ncbi:MAG TPA: cobyric acid synthase [Pseudogracilibacillus sp.]|nr:cobyric acid synthase [Pseudogracilibacillus sp.]
MRGLMIQGTASDVGKSIVMTVLCRVLANKGFQVAPFKSQNMSTKLFTTRGGDIISRAQQDQARAAKQEPSVYMNPIVLIMQQEMKSEVILSGKRKGIVTGREYHETYYDEGLTAITNALCYLKKHYDIILMEGAGSPVELNLKERELVNMKVAEVADVPVILVVDIERGGVFASIVGTLTLMKEKERQRIEGIIINKFRGDRSMFNEGVSWIEEYTKLPVLGVLPVISHGIAPEDTLSEEGQLYEENRIMQAIDDPYEDIADKLEPFLNIGKILSIIQQG